MIYKIILSCFFTYLIGSIPTGFIMGKLTKGIDIRNFGSGNIGTTNSIRILGKKIGILVFLIDFFKGYFSILLASYLIVNEELLFIPAFFTIIGNLFTIFLKFKGGKGVATSAGVFFALSPISFSFALLTFILVIFISKYVSLSSIFACFALAMCETILYVKKLSNLNLLIFVYLICLLILLKHISNIKRILRNEESKIINKK